MSLLLFRTLRSTKPIFNLTLSRNLTQAPLKDTFFYSSSGDGIKPPKQRKLGRRALRLGIYGTGFFVIGDFVYDFAPFSF